MSQLDEFLNKNPWDLTVKEFLIYTKEMNAGSMTLRMSGKDDKTKAMIMAFVGEEECADIEGAIAEVEARWEAEQ